MATKSAQHLLREGVESQQVSLVQQALSRGASVNEVDESYIRLGPHRTALQRAAAIGDADIVQLLINNNATITHKPDGTPSALQLATENGNMKCVEILLDAGADIYGAVPFRDKGTGPLVDAIMNGHEEILQLLLKTDFDINANRAGILALVCAIGEENERMVKMLLDRGVSLNNIEDKGLKLEPLNFAVEHGLLSIAKLLVAHGAAADKVNPNEWTEEDFAAVRESARNDY